MKVLLLLLLVPFIGIRAQNSTFSEINSKNILQLISTLNSTQEQKINHVTEILQVGKNNTVEVFNRSQKSNLEFTQLGNYNTTFFINPEAKKSAETKVNVNGFNNHVDVTGSNSISEKIQLNIKGDNKMIFMRNY